MDTYLHLSLVEIHNALHSFYIFNTELRKHHRYISYSSSYATVTSFIFYPKMLQNTYTCFFALEVGGWLAV